MFEKGNKLGEKHRKLCPHGVFGASTCKDCRREISKRYHQRHREELLPAIRERSKKWVEKNKDRHRENGRKWKADNRERVNEQERRRRRIKHGTKDAHGETKYAPCDICQKVRKLHFDHNHATGHFRGWLCYECNPRFEWVLEYWHAIQKYIEVNHQNSQAPEVSA